MSCAKKRVVCTIVFPDGVRFVGTNDCNRPQAACPRLPGEGYAKCVSVCDQPHHAEIGALQAARRAGRKYGGVAYITGIQAICGDCLEQMAEFGINKVRMEPPP